MTVRIAYNLFTQRPKQELDDFAKWVTMTRPGEGSDFYRMNGAGEMLTFSAADFEDFLEPRPDLPASLEQELTRGGDGSWPRHRWPFRLHATYDESIGRFLDVFEAVNRERALQRPALVLRPRRDDHRAEPGAGQGARRRHRRAAPHGLPGRVLHRPLRGRRRTAHAAHRRRCCSMGIPVGAGTDATRVASYNPWVSLYWLVAGKTVGGTALYPEANRLDRMEALRRYTVGSAWFSGEEDKKGAIVPGQLADLAVLSADYFSVPEEEIKGIESRADAGGRQGRVRGGRLRPSRSAAAAGPARLVARQGVWRLPPSPAARRPHHPGPRLRPRHPRAVAPLPRLDSAGQAGAAVGRPGLRVLGVLSRRHHTRLGSGILARRKERCQRRCERGSVETGGA